MKYKVCYKVLSAVENGKGNDEVGCEVLKGSQGRPY